MRDEVWVELAERRYAVITEPGGPAEVAHHVQRAHPAGTLLVLSDSNVGPLHADAVAASLSQAGRSVLQMVVPAGEASKSIATMERLWTEALEFGVDRGAAIVAIGGGVVGDIGGFLASTLLRGVALVQVPTTVLAMADAAIGGKTGVNTVQGKNLVGTFYQPSVVIQWVGALPTLSERERRSGVAEVVKSALIAGDAELDAFIARSSGIASGDLPSLSWAVRMAGAVKADIVSRDEREGGLRKLLNLGHTFGHAIEHASGYGSWAHGEAVSAGMVIALRYGETLGMTDSSLTERVVEILSEQKLPVTPPSLTLPEWSLPLGADKKRQGDSVQLILCAGPGECRVVPQPLADVVDWLRTLC